MQSSIGQNASKPVNVFNYVPAFSLAMIGFVAIAYLTIFSVPPGTIVAVVFPPWTPVGSVMAKVITADSRIVRFALGDTIVVVSPERHDFAQRVKELGAWAVVNPLAFGGCGTGIDATEKLAAGPLVSKPRTGQSSLQR